MTTETPGPDPGEAPTGANVPIPAEVEPLAEAGERGIDLALPGNPESWIVLRQTYGIVCSGSRCVLPWDEDKLVPRWIKKEHEAATGERLNVCAFIQARSTNDCALEKARLGAPEGTLVCAERQTAGRGRLGRHWHSPTGAGLYFSLILCPRGQQGDRWPLLTHVTAIALAGAIRDLWTLRLGRDIPDLEIKWPNDVLLAGKKTGGILLETTRDANGRPAAIVGVGLNIRPASVPSELSSTATCLDTEAGIVVPRRWMLLQFLLHLRDAYQLFIRGSHERILSIWKEHSRMWSGQKVEVADASGLWLGVTCGLTEIGALMVRREHGATEVLLAGDVRVRKTRE